jgi:hydrogenase maturation factor
VQRIDGSAAWVDVGGTNVRVACDGVADLMVGEWVACYAGTIVDRLDAEEARAILDALAAIDGAY